MTYPINTKEILSGVPEQDALVYRKYELNYSSAQLDTIPDQIEQQQVTYAEFVPKQIDPMPNIPPKPAGLSVTAVGEAQRAVTAAYGEN